MRIFTALFRKMKIELAGTYGYRRMIKTSLPSILMMLAISVYSIVDGLFVSYRPEQRNSIGRSSYSGL